MEQALAGSNPPAPSGIQLVQRTLGNQAIQRLANSRANGNGSEAATGDPIADSGTLMPANLRFSQHVYGNQFVQRLSRGGVFAGQRAQCAEGGNGGAAMHPQVESAIERKRGEGQSLPDGTRQQMESGLGADLSSVRVHDDDESHDLNRSLNAHAFTTGEDVFFGEGEYAPHNGGGQRLIAHEMAHVVQQDGAEPQASQSRVAIDAPGNKYSRKADATAKQATGARVKKKAKAAPTPLAGKMATPVQRAEEFDEEKQEEEAERKEEKSKAAARDKKEKGQDEVKSKSDAGDKKPRKVKSTKPVPEMKPPSIGVAPAPQVSPAVPEVTEDRIPEEGQAESQMDESAEQAGADVAALSWEALGPPGWNDEVLLAESFAALFSEEAQAEGSGSPGSQALQLMEADDPILPTLFQSDYHKHLPQAIPVLDLPATEKPIWKIDKPKHKNFFANIFIGGTWNKGIDIANAVGALTTESNVFGYMAAILETAIKVMELITTVLSYVVLILQITALVLRLVALVLEVMGTALLAIANALLSSPLTFGFAPPFISAGITLLNVSTTLQGWAQTLGGVAKTIGLFCKAMTILRLKMRAVTALLRGLDVLYSLAMGASWKDLQGKLGKIVDQATGAAKDGIILGLGALASKVPVGQPIAGLGAKIGANIGGKILGGVVGTVGGYFKDKDGNFLGRGNPFDKDVASKYWSEKGKSTYAGGWEKKGAFGEQGVTLNLAPAQDADETEGERKVIAIEGPPERAPFAVQGAAHNLGILSAEKVVLKAQLAWIEAAIADKQEWEAGMGAARVQSAADQAKMDEGIQTGQKQIAVSRQFRKKAGQLEQKGQEGAADAGNLGEGIASQQGNMQSGMEKAKGQGTSQPGADPSEAQGGPEQASQAMGESSKQAKQGTVQAGKAEQATAQKITQVGRVAQEYQELDIQLGETQGKNREELEMLVGERESLLTRLGEIEGQEAEEQAAHAEALGEAQAWTDEAAAQREGEMRDALVEKGGKDAPDKFEALVLEDEPEKEEPGEGGS